MTMKLKIFSSTDEKNLEIVYNEFAENNAVQFSPMHLVWDDKEKRIIYTIAIYYKDKSDSKAATASQAATSSERVETLKPCPKCKEMIGAHWREHFKCGWDSSKATATA